MNYNEMALKSKSMWHKSEARGVSRALTYYVNVDMRRFAPQAALFMLNVERLASNEVRPMCFKSGKIKYAAFYLI